MGPAILACLGNCPFSLVWVELEFCKIQLSVYFFYLLFIYFSPYFMCDLLVIVSNNLVIRKAPFIFNFFVNLIFDHMFLAMLRCRLLLLCGL